MYQEFANARLAEVRVAETKIKHRIEWTQFTRVDRLERALRVARGRVQAPASGVLNTNH